MRNPLLALAVLLALLSGPGPALPAHDSSVAQRAETVRKYDLDPASPLESRVRETPASVMKLFEQEGDARPTPHVLTEGERRKLAAAFASLTPLHKEILKERLRSVSFLDGMPNTALTSTVNPDEPYKLFDITIRAAILHQTASEWLTEKERSMFSAEGPGPAGGGSPALRVSIDAGNGDALLFALLHEATHVVDACLRITPDHTRHDPPTPFTQDVWVDRTTPASAYHDALRERIRFRPGGEVLSIDQAPAVYQSLLQTPFVSLYGSSNWYDDLAEYVAAYHWTAKLHQPYRIVVRRAENGPELILEPMKSTLVRKRAGQMNQFYEPGDRAASPGNSEGPFPDADE